MKRTLSIFLICACSLSAMGQSPMESILSSVEDNNTTLKALRLEMEAEKLSNDAEATLADPEFEFAYSGQMSVRARPLTMPLFPERKSH